VTVGRRPNVLFITSDQQRGDCYGFEGRKVRTPHLDVMARDGARFAACITPNLVCQPSRASILTGLLPYTHGVSDNGIDLDPAVGEAGFAGAFARAGYRTGYIGKAHFATSHTFRATGTPECRNTDQPQDWNGPYMGFEHVELVVEGHNHWPPMKPPRGQHYERFFHRDGRGEALQRLYETQLEPRSTAVQTFHSALPVAFHNSTWIGDRTIRFLAAHQDERRSPTRTTRSTRRCRGACSIIRTRSTCRRTARSTSSAARGGTGRASKGSPRSCRTSRRSGPSIRASRSRPTGSCAS
jgi:arylsulfatase A-like enzyme